MIRVTGLLLLLLIACLPAQVTAESDRQNAAQVIYEVNLRQYTPEGTIAAFQEHLPRLKKLGVDILWLMPIHPIGEERRKGGLGSAYSVRDYRAVNPDFGNLEDLQELVRVSHDMGFRVLIDWVANHCAWDNAAVTRHPDWFTRDDNGNMQPPVADWHDVVDFDFDSNGLRDWMTDNMLYWLREADIDGFRCDVAGMVPLDYWEHAIPELRAEKDIFMLAEWSEPELHDVFDMSYQWDLHHVFNRIAAGEAGAPELLAQLEQEGASYPAGSLRMLFTSNHDENSWNGTVRERLGSAVNLFAMLSYTLPGIPLIYSGQEAGLDHRLAFFEKDEISWRDHELTGLYARLNQLKHDHPALHTGCMADGGFRSLQPVHEDPQALVFLREGGGRSLLVAANLSTRPRLIRLRDLDPDIVWNELDPGLIKWSGGELLLALPAWGWTLLDAERIH